MLLQKAERELQKARASVRRMLGAKRMDAAENCWLDCIQAIERAHNKIEAELREYPRYQGWTRRGHVKRLRKQDALLAYLKNARDANEHSIADVTRRQPGGVGISGVDGGPLHIRSLHSGPNGISIDAGTPISIRFDPGRLSLVPVENRGRTYEPPSSHLGRPVAAADPESVALSGISFYQAYIDEIREFVNNGGR